MSEIAAESQAGADLDQLEDVQNVEDDLDEELDGLSDDDFADDGQNGLHAIEDAEHHASFSVRHGFQAVDPGVTKKIAQAGVVFVVGAALWGLRRLLRRGERLSSDNAWAWTTAEQPGPQGSIDIGVAVDSGGDSLLPAACMGVYSMRTSSSALPVQSSDLPQPGTSCSAMAFTVKQPVLMLKVAKALGLPGSASVDELRVMLAADMFIMTEAITGERVTNGIVTRSITTWLSDREHARQVNLLEWLAKELSGWDYFAPEPRGKPDPKQVLLSISAAHKIIRDYEWQQTAPEGGWLDDPAATIPEVEKSDYNAALQLRDDLQVAMRKALSPMVLMVVPVLAGAAPRVPSYSRPLPPAAVAMADMSRMMNAFVAMTGCPASVLPVPAISARGAPWAVLLVGCHRCDLQVANYSSKMGDHIQKTVQAMIQELKEEKAGKKKAPVKAMSAAEKQEQSDAFKKQGNEAFKAGNYKEAATLFTAALELTPNNAVLYSNRAQAHINLEMFKVAISDCDQSLKCQFTPKAALRRGSACVALALWEDAITSFQAVLSREPRNSQAQEQLQLCKDMLGNSLQTAAVVADESGML